MNDQVIYTDLRPGRVERTDSKYIDVDIWIGGDLQEVRFEYHEGAPPESIKVVHPPVPDDTRERLERFARNELVEFARNADAWLKTPEGRRSRKGQLRAQQAVDEHITDPFARAWLAQGIARAAANPAKMRQIEQRTIALVEKLSARHLALLVASFTEEFDEQRFEDLIRMVASMPVDGLPGA